MKIKKMWEDKTFIWVLVSAIVIMCRFISMNHMPDFFVDELSILNHMKSILETGYDTFGNYLPLYSDVNGGYITFTYMYPMMFFLSIIGVSDVKARFVQQVLTILVCYLTAQGMKLWTNNNNKMFWITFLTGLTLPWGFVQANRVWDPSFVPIYFGLYFFFFSLLMRKRNKSKVETYAYSILTFVFLVLLATVYPAARIPAVAMWIYSLIWAIRDKKIRKGHVVVIFIVSTLAALPLAINLLNPVFNSRSKMLVIFFQDIKWYQQLHILKESFLELINPAFLFAGGDRIYRHSLPVWGMLGTLNIIPFIALLRSKKLSSVAIYMFFTIGVTNFSTALTYEYQPHSLRSCLAWLPYVILLSYGWLDFLDTRSKKGRIFWYIVMIVQFVLYIMSFNLIHRGSVTFNI